MTTAEYVLKIRKAARELISSPTNWCRGHDALDAANNDCHPLSPFAVAWCLRGAVIRCSPDGMVGDILPDGSTVINDTGDHATVLAYLDGIIARGEGGKYD